MFGSNVANVVTFGRAMARAWEQDIRAWEQDLYHGGEDDGSGAEQESIDYGRLSPEEAGDCLSSMLIELKLTGVLSAKQACVLSFYATAAGATGFVSGLAMRPDSHSGSFARHFDRALDINPEPGDDFYEVRLPVYKRSEAARSTQEVPVATPRGPGRRNS